MLGGLFNLIFRLGTDNTDFNRGLGEATARANTAARGMTAGFTRAFASLFAAGALTKQIIDLGGEVKDLSDRLGVSVEEVQEFSLAARLGGQDAGTFARAIERIRLAMVEGASGKNPLAQFGITLQELQSGDAVGILRKLSEALKDTAMSADQFKSLVDVMGARGAGGVINMLKELQNAKGSFLTKEEVDLLDRGGDALTKFWTNLKLMGAKFIFLDEKAKVQLGLRKQAPAAGALPAVEGIEAQMALEKKTTEDLAKLRQETDELNEKNRRAQLTDEERLNELLMERTELIRRLQFALDEKGAAEIQFQLAQNAAGLLVAQKALAPGAFSLPSSRGLPRNTDALLSVGNFLGSAPDSELSRRMEQQTRELKAIRAAIEKQGIKLIFD